MYEFACVCLDLLFVEIFCDIYHKEMVFLHCGFYYIIIIYRSKTNRKVVVHLLCFCGCGLCVFLSRDRVLVLSNLVSQVWVAVASPLSHATGHTTSQKQHICFFFTLWHRFGLHWQNWVSLSFVFCIRHHTRLLQKGKKDQYTNLT